MQVNQEIFVLVAEELSISRAAQRAYVTQQCVSDHIKRLEQQYGVALFTRKPRFLLTEHGQELLSVFRQIKRLEQSAQVRMAKRAQGERGSFRMGISPSRASVILPWILPEFYERFPEINVSFLLNDTVLLEESLQKREIDLFLGVNTRYHEDFEYLSLGQDEICMTISDGLLNRLLGGSVVALETAGLDLRLLERVPFIKSSSTSAVNQLMDGYMAWHKIKLDFPYQISDTATQISLCATGVCAAFVPKMLLSGIQHRNLYCPKEEYIHVVSLAQPEGASKYLRIELVSRKGAPPKFIHAFERILRDAISTQYKLKWRDRQVLKTF